MKDQTFHSEDPLVEKSLKNSVKDGILASATSGFTQDYFTPFLLLLGGTAQQVGLLNSLPNLFGSLIQLKSAEVTERAGSRKKVISFFVFLQALMLIPMAMMAFTQNANPFTFILCVTLFAALGAFVSPVWGSLMSDLVPEKRRGEYFGWRNRMLGFVLVGSSFVAGILLYCMQKINIFYGFFLVFLSASVFRLVSWRFLTKMLDPQEVHKKGEHFTFFQFIRRIKKSNFAQFVVFIATMNFSVNLASPYFSVFMLRDLHFNYLLYTVITIMAPLSIYLLIGRWGRHADKVGNLKVLRLTAPIIAILPALWIINRHPVFLLFIQFIAGFAWAGFNLCATNFIYDAVTPQKRIRCIAYFNVLNGTALCAGSLLGGFMLHKLPPLFGYQILTLFLISTVLRIFVSLFVPLNIKEVRAVHKVDSNELFFSMIGMKPLIGIERRTVRY